MLPEVRRLLIPLDEKSDPKIKAGKEGTFKATVEFLIKYF